MTVTQHIITIALCSLATIITRYTPFFIFSEKKKTPPFILYIGKYLPSAVFGMLVVYSLKNVQILEAGSTHGLPELIAILITVGLHLFKRQMLISIAGGTIAYMLLIHFVFI